MKNSKSLIFISLILITLIGISAVSASSNFDDNDSSLLSDSNDFDLNGLFDFSSSDNSYSNNNLASSSSDSLDLDNLLSFSSSDIDLLGDGASSYPYDKVTLVNFSPYKSVIGKDLGKLEVYWKDGKIIGVTPEGTFNNKNGNVSSSDMITNYNDQLNQYSSYLSGESIYPNNSTSVNNSTDNSTVDPSQNSTFVKPYDRVTRVNTSPYASLLGHDYGTLEIYWKNGKVIGVTPDGVYKASNGNVPTSAMITGFNDKLNSYSAILQYAGDTIYGDPVSAGGPSLDTNIPGTGNSSSNSGLSGGLGLGSLFSSNSNPSNNSSGNGSLPNGTNNNTNGSNTTGMQNTGLPIAILIGAVVVGAAAMYNKGRKR
ncbi:hypothetical protein BGI41_06460 [Methanobrevibacter sp. 87.7]|uniref:hypothetical protein n=1 Tax=Methanobrevibacter sp. 87.7 TaxID=387957 RepID=UPI000B50678F|nr:hypothetical protein [Methanobrevibacter sp. 87.7]OWT32671.1 hypothetical protein BGI41_06460 [Methanobrevibacter sp. 87.7]